MVIEQKFKEGEEPDPTEFLFVSLEQKRKDQTSPYDGKTACWVPDEKEGFARGVITGQKGDLTTVKVGDEEKSWKKDKVMQVNPPKYEKAEDMSNLTYLNEGAVLNNLKQRYYIKLIYTYSGLFCVAINPYKRYPIYTNRAMKLYHGKRRNEVPPHIFAIADGAYSEMMTNHMNQSILITGESGAGKTENTKKVIAYFASVGASGKGEVKKISLEDQIVQTNPVLEAFGNAKTTRNDNSSRFGKFIRIHFGPSGKLAGGDIETYLLEKARVISQQPLERSYHMFYQIMSGFVPGLKQSLFLGDDIYAYHFISQGKTTIPGVDDSAELEQTHIAFEILNFTDQERTDVYKVTAAVMHLGELKFKNQGEQAVGDETAEGDCTAKLLGVKGEDIYNNFCKPRIKVGTEFVTKGQNAAQCFYAVGAISKAIYDRVFKFLVKKCNQTLDTPNKKVQFIGVLDIAGFEIFDYNGFEQLCINFTNEKLQQFFNHHMFVLEQEEYKKEGLDWIFEDFGMDLQACIDMMERPMGVFSILEEESMFPKATDHTFIEKLNINLLGKSPCFIKPRPAKPGQLEAHFGCVHYAGTVPYSITSWLEKNKDPLNDTLVDTLKKGNNALVHECFADHPGQSGGKEEGKGKGGKGSGFRTVSSSYREQLNNLMTTLRATHPHFIRCIIPNELKTPGLIDSTLVMHQLTCNGVLEGIRICRKGFPNRMLYNDFVFRYQILAANQMRAQKDDKKIAEACFDHIGLEANKWRVGHTKVFFRAGVLGEMEEIREDKINAIMVHLQSEIRKYQTFKSYKKMADQRKALEVCQRSLKSYVRLRCWPWWGLWKIIKPKLVITDTAADMKKIEDRIAKSTAAFQGEEIKRKEEEQKNKKLQTEFDTLNKMMDELQGNASDFNSKIGKLNEQKADLDNQLNDMSNRLSMEEDARRQLEQQQKKMNQELARTKQDIEDNEKRFAEVNGDIAAKSKQISNLNEEIQHQEELIHKQTKEKKAMQEQMQKTSEAAQIQEDKLNNLNKVKTKLERGLDELDDEVARNKKLRTEVEKSKNKLEGDLKLCQEATADLNRLKQELETAIQRKDKEIASLTGKIEDESALIAKLMRQIKELQARIVELEEELEAERNARAKATKLRADLARTLEELGESLEEAGGQTSVQIEFNKKREADIAKLKREVEDTNLVHETQMANIRKKHNDTVSEMAEQVDNLNKLKAKAEKERSQCESELNDLRASMDQLSSEKASAGKMSNILQQQIHELQNKFEQAAKNANEADMSKKKMSIENTDMTRQLEEVESQMSVLSKLKVSLSTQLEDTKKMADEEAREKATLMGKFRNVERDLDTLREQLDESSEGKGEILKQISKANADAQFYKTKYETEAVARCEELDESRRKLQQRLGEAEETIESLKTKSVHLERTRIKITQNIEEMRSEVDKSTALVQQAEKKQMHFDKILNEWREKVQDLTCELDASRKEARNFGTELFRTKAQHEEIQEGLEVARRENKNLAEEVKDLVEQITEGGRNIHEIEKQKNRLQIEKEELQAALEEAESALEQEENKVLRVQLELSQIRQDIDRRIAEKEEEFENTRKNHMRTLESIQASLQAEQKAKNDTLSMKNKLEVEINELEIALDHSNKSNADAQRTIKRYLAQIQEFTTKIEEEQGARDAAREAYGTAERRANALAHELEESRSIYEQADRARRQGEQELLETRDHINDLSGQVTNLASIERKLKGELQAVHSDLEQILNEAKNSEEKAKKAMLDAARLADDLRVEQEYTQNHEKARKALESQIKDLQARLEYAENDAIKGARVHISALESKIRQVEQEIDIEQKRHIEAQKNMRKSDRRAKELQFQSEEDRKNHEKMQDLVDKLQQKIKTYKVQIEEAEEIAALNLAKFTKSQQECEEAIERCDQAEATLIKMRAKGRGGFM